MSDQNTIEITPETIQKAYETLGIDQEVISKAESEGSEEDEEEDEMEMKKDKKKKMEKSISDLKEQLQKAEDELAGLEGEKPKEKIEKGGENEILKAIHSSNEIMGKKFEAMATLNKNLENQLGETREELEKAQEKIQALEDTPIRKSITTQNYIEKAFQEDDNGNKMLSLSQHKREIQGMLIEKAGYDKEEIEKADIDKFWENEMTYFESTNSLHPKAVQRLLKDDKIEITR